MNKITVIFLLFICFGCHKAKQTQIKADISLNRIMIPVEINGDTIMMLWDTGCSTSILTKQTADKLGVKSLDKSDSSLTAAFTFDYTILDTVKNSINNTQYFKDTIIKVCNSEYAQIKIGDLLTERDFNITEHKTASNIIGGNIINKYRWLFDFEKGTVQISDRSFKPLFNNVTDSIELDFVLDRYQTPILDITLGVDTLKLLFDTGMSKTFNLNYRNKQTTFHFDILISARDTMDNTTQKFRNLCKRNAIINTNPKKMQITNMWAYCDSIMLNNYAITTYVYFKTGSMSKNTDGYLTYSFARRFNAMYYDPYKGKIKLYKLAGVESLRKDISIDSLFQLKK